MRACHAADRTGHMILQTLYQQCIKQGVTFFDEFEMLDLIFEDGACRGIVAIEIATSELHIFHAKSVLLATGGFGRMFKVSSNAYALTGDGPAIAYRHGLPLEDMEFYQFHPTGIYRLGILLSEACRGDGGIMFNGVGERFMEKYAPNLKDLASRDVCSRSIYQEVRAGRGVGGKDYVYLDIRAETMNKYKTSPLHPGRDVDSAWVESRLPDIIEFARTYLGVDPIHEPMPIQPTAHYAMGGLPTDLDGRILRDAVGTVVSGLYSAGESACVSVHGAEIWAAAVASCRPPRCCRRSAKRATKPAHSSCATKFGRASDEAERGWRASRPGSSRTSYVWARGSAGVADKRVHRKRSRHAAMGGVRRTTIHTATHFGAPLVCAAAVATLGALEEARLPERAHAVGARWMGTLRDHTEGLGVADVRGRGLMVGVALEGGASRALAVTRGLLERGWIVLTGGTQGDVLTLTPPLDIDERLLTAFAGALADTLRALPWMP